ncbi:MAG: lipoate-protein ligase A related protein, partial [Planctomycetaceae bacterium]|nr:lipoate-protein ligase A related protein [Planctomycetaceae bacterium]
MQLLDITYDSVIKNIALDEALLLYSEQTGEQFLRFWKPQRNAVVMGRSGKLEQEAAQEYCRNHTIPVYRRPSGGGTILTGPGCLMYTIVLNSNLNGRLKEIQGCHDFVLGQMATAFKNIGIPCCILGISDLAIGNLKFSGNS